MRKYLFILFIAGLFLSSLPGCKKQPVDPSDPAPNPYTGLIGWNGFVFDTTRYQTPNAYVENWGENLDSLSADFDIKFTDGIFDSKLHDVRDYTIMVYFDVNSPSSNHLSDGTYVVELTRERKPRNIVEAWIELSAGDKIFKFMVTEGTVNIEQKDGYMLITYDAVLNNANRITGQYTGKIKPIRQVLDNR